MKMKITGIEDTGNLEKERIVLKVLDDVDVGRYAIFKSKKIGDKKVSNKVSLTFWFQDQPVKKDDLVVVYTKAGTYKSTVNPSGNTSHFFYWDLSSAIWNNEDAVVLLNVGEWSVEFVKNKDV